MRDISATDAARAFSELLDAVEHGHESFVVVRRGRAVARITPAAEGSGRPVKELLLRHPSDADWGHDLQEIRSLVVAEDRWND